MWLEYPREGIGDGERGSWHLRGTCLSSCTVVWGGGARMMAEMTPGGVCGSLGREGGISGESVWQAVAVGWGRQEATILPMGTDEDLEMRFRD